MQSKLSQEINKIKGSKRSSMLVVDLNNHSTKALSIEKSMR